MIIVFFCCCSMGLTLHQHSHSHSGLESHNHEASGPSSANINVRAAYIHVLGDIIQSLGVLIAAIIVYYKVSSKCTIYCHNAPLGTLLTLVFNVRAIWFLWYFFRIALSKPKARGLRFWKRENQLYWWIRA